jgi:DNA-binding LacI/PurR family transcriptional regulator
MSILELSKLSGVSTATVSRVLNGNPQVSPASVVAVQKAVAAIGYTTMHRYRRKPKAGEARLTGQSGNVALLFPDSIDYAMRTPLAGRFMHGITQVLMSRHLNMLCTLLHPNGDMPLCISQRQVDGVIIRGAVPVVEPFEAKLLGLPAVWLLELPEIPSRADQVLEDTLAIGQMAARYLLGKGCRSLAVANPEPDHPCYRPRTEAFVNAARAAGADVKILLGGTPWELADRFVALRPRPMGVFVPFADAEAVQFYRRLSDGGVKPGKDLWWIGTCYDVNTPAMLDPALPNIDIRPEAMAGAAAEMLLWRMRHPSDPRRRLMIAPELVDPAGRTAKK